jgi:HSP20 family protein
MRSRIHAVVLPSEVGEFTDEVRQIFEELRRDQPLEGLTGECSPPVDVYETDGTVEITMDLPGVTASAVRIVGRGSALLIAGEKTPRRSRGDSSFHLVERGFGRFARAIRVSTPCDLSRARAQLAGGELRITLPKVAERRGRSIPIAVTSGEPVS